MVLGSLNSLSRKEHSRYLGGIEETPPTPTNRSDKGVYYLCCPTEGRSETAGAGVPEAPDDTSTIERFVAALKERPKGAKLLVAGDFNTTWRIQRETRRERISWRPWTRKD